MFVKADVFMMRYCREIYLDSSRVLKLFIARSIVVVQSLSAVSLHADKATRYLFSVSRTEYSSVSLVKKQNLMLHRITVMQERVQCLCTDTLLFY